MRQRRSPAALRLAVILPAVALLLATATLARADLIFFKDGFTISGKIREERTLMIDSFSKESWVLPKGVYIDAGARRVFFGYGQMEEGQKTLPQVEDAIGTGRKIILPDRGRGIPIVVEVVHSGPFNEKWDRVFVYRTVGRDVYVPQHIMELSSSYVRVDATRDFIWSAYYTTQELGFEQVRRLLMDHPSFHDPVSLAPAKRAERRFRLYHFLVHAGWHNEAADELDAILRDLPKEKKKVEEERERLNKLQVQRHFEQIMRGYRAGQHQWVQEQTEDFREQYATQKAVDEVRAIGRAYKQNKEKMKEVRDFLKAQLKHVRGEEETLFTEATKAIQAELHNDTISRLDTFLEQARQAAKQEKNKGK